MCTQEEIFIFWLLSMSGRHVFQQSIQIYYVAKSHHLRDRYKSDVLHSRALIAIEIVYNDHIWLFSSIHRVECGVLSVVWLMLSGWSGPSVRNWWVPQSVDSRLWRYHHPSRCTHILIRFKVDRCRWRHRNHPKTQQHCQTPQCNAIYRLWCLDKQKKKQFITQHH